MSREKKILIATKCVCEKVLGGESVFVGKYNYNTKEITPSDKITHDGEKYTQEGVERKGISFQVKRPDIAYTVKDYKTLVATGENQKGGNVCFVFFQYS